MSSRLVTQRPIETEDNLKGLIFDVQGFSVHDGPGCRTLLFLKGCPLKCEWCANPEGRGYRSEIMFSSGKCSDCTYNCVPACPWGAITVPTAGGQPQIDRSKCVACAGYDCTKSCYNSALRPVGRYVTIDEILRTIQRDRGYWGENGGVTLGGGEPLAQPDFALRLLEELHQSYVHTAIETCAHVPWKYLSRALEFTDWLFVDIKHMDPDRHREGTGVTNKLILDNIERISALSPGPRVIIRVPVIPGFNDTDQNMEATAKFLRRIGKNEVNLLPFHRLATTKFEQLGLVYKYRNVEPPTAEKMDHLRRVFEINDIRCSVGSDTAF